MVEQKQFCTFFLDGHMFGVEVEQVQEVFRYQEMTKVPLAPQVVRGLINLRGQIITAIDLRQRLGMEPLPEDKFPMNVVVRTKDGVVSLWLTKSRMCWKFPKKFMKGHQKPFLTMYDNW